MLYKSDTNGFVNCLQQMELDYKSVKLVSWNVNGIRAASKKPEFWDWFNSTNADIINFQEVRATEDSIPEKLTDVAGFNSYFNEAEKKGYSGVRHFF